ncbi:MAG: 50S ribosomal protein L21 [Desulfatiglans sp.]|jgi:large subunit ribosomal protein L21|nr:50S ribosomal protein L21 [Desulfatiglans sp.]
MYAVIQTGGKQYRVAPGDMLKIEKLEGNIGDSVAFDKVLFTSDGDNVNLGKPYLEGAKVYGKIMRQAKDKKVIVFKYKRRKNYRKKQGHRQCFTQIKIDNIGQ